MNGEQAEKAPETNKAIFAINLGLTFGSPKRALPVPFLISAPQARAWSSVGKKLGPSPMERLGYRHV